MKAVALPLVLLCFTACSVNIKMPVNRFDSPETIGQPGVIKGEVGLQGISEVVLTDDPGSSTPPETANPVINSENRVRMAAAYSAVDFLDVEYRPPLGASIKAQILGDSYKSAKAGNFSLAASLGLKYGMNQHPDPTQSKTIEMKFNETIFDAALITGYRVVDIVLFYGGVFTVSNSYSGTWHQTTDFDGSAKVTGFNLGSEISAANFQVRLEYALGKTVAGNTEKTVNSFGLNTGYLF